MSEADSKPTTGTIVVSIELREKGPEVKLASAIACSGERAAFVFGIFAGVASQLLTTVLGTVPASDNTAEVEKALRKAFGHGVGYGMQACEELATADGSKIMVSEKAD